MTVSSLRNDTFVKDKSESTLPINMNPTFQIRVALNHYMSHLEICYAPTRAFHEQNTGEL